MNDFAQWQEANGRFLATAIADLRARLERLAPDAQTDETPAASTAPVEARNPASWWQRIIGSGSDAASSAPLLLADTKTVARDEATVPVPDAPEAEAIPAADDGKPPALSMLQRILGLSDFERDLLLLCASMEFDTRMGALCERAQNDPGKPFPTFALAMAMLDQPAWDALSPERPLRYWRIVEIIQPGAQPLIGSALKADERIVSYLKGANYLDDRLAPFVERIDAGATELPASQRQWAATIVARMQSGGARDFPLVQLFGSDAASKSQVAAHAASALGLTLYRLDADGIPAALADQETFLRLWERETALLRLALYIDADEIDRLSAQGGPVQRLLARVAGVCFVALREPWPGTARPTLSIDVAKPTPDEQKAAWRDALGEEAAASAQRPAMHFSFDVATIREISAEALAAARSGGGKLDELLWQRSVARARPILDQLAQRIDVKARWDDLKLPPAEKSTLRQIIDQVEHRDVVYDDWGFRARMNRGLGVSVLFAGASGTGKTMAAEVIANELGLPLYRVDLSTVVNKYIGETEKNLRRLFDAAEDGGGILCCDECESLFLARGGGSGNEEITRHENRQTDYLLQRLESFRGLAILTTNMKSAIDSAFLRRLRFVVNFPYPSATERAAIWRDVFPAGVSTDALDVDRLARFNLSGGSILNCALAAAFLAASAGTPVTMPLVLEALRGELRKLERPINEADFRWLDSVARAS
ncbi:MAG: AAA family ATPase [Burkholderiaceae bacterium]